MKGNVGITQAKRNRERTMKPCSRCRQQHEAPGYYCRACRAAYVRNWRAEQRALIVAALGPCHICGAPRDRVTSNNCKACRQTHGNQRQRVNGNARAYANVYQKRGHLAASPCVSCGAPKAEKHHHDYSKPLEVEWLCRRCHLARHRAEQTVSHETKGPTA